MPPSGPRAVDALGPAGVVLEQRLGPDVYKSWFGKVTIASETPETVTLVATRFVASTIRRDYEPQLLAAFQAINPTVKQIEVRSP